MIKNRSYTGKYLEYYELNNDELIKLLNEKKEEYEDVFQILYANKKDDEYYEAAKKEFELEKLITKLKEIANGRKIGALYDN